MHSPPPHSFTRNEKFEKREKVCELCSVRVARLAAHQKPCTRPAPRMTDAPRGSGRSTGGDGSGSSALRRRATALNRLLLHQERSAATGAAGTTESGTDSVLYVIMSSARNRERAVLQQRTWCRLAQCVFVVDADFEAEGLSMRLVRVDASALAGREAPPAAESCCTNATTTAATRFFCDRHRMRTLSAQYRYLPALRWAKRELERPNNRQLRWAALLDDDSFVFPRGLRRVLATYNARAVDAPMYLGDFWKRSDDASPEYACGGGGSIFSRSALMQMDLSRCIRAQSAECAQSDWMIGRCARDGGVRFEPRHGCTCVPWRHATERRVRERLHAGSCAFLQFPNSPGARGGPFKDLVPMLRNLSRAGLEPAVVHQLGRLV